MAAYEGIPRGDESGEPQPGKRRSITRRDMLSGLVGFVVGVGASAGAGYALRGELLRWALGSDDSYYTQLDWDRVKIPKDRQPAWREFEGDPDMHSENPSDFNYVGLVAVNANVMDEQMHALDAVQASAWQVWQDSEETVDIGTMRTGQSFFSSVVGDSTAYVFGQRIGGKLRWTPALQRRQTGELIVPEDAGVIKVARIAITDLQDQYPGAIYI